MPAVTADQVFAACADLQARGVMPTARQVRLITQAGSFSTIQEFIRQWRETQPKPPEPEPISPEIAALQQIAPSALETVRQSVAQRFTADLEAQSAVNSRLTQENADLRTLLSELEERLARTEAVAADQQRIADGQQALLARLVAIREDMRPLATDARVDRLAQAVEESQQRIITTTSQQAQTLAHAVDRIVESQLQLQAVNQEIVTQINRLQAATTEQNLAVLSTLTALRQEFRAALARTAQDVRRSLHGRRPTTLRPDGARP